MLRIRQVMISAVALCAILLTGSPKVEAGSTGTTNTAVGVVVGSGILCLFHVFCPNPKKSPNPLPTPTPAPSQTPPGLVLSTGVGISPASMSTLYTLFPNAGSSPATDTIGFTDQYTNPSLSIDLEANFPVWRVGGYASDGGAEWLYGTVGTGTNKTDLITGLTLGGTDGQTFLTIGLRQITTQELFDHSVGQRVPSNTSLSDITFNRHTTRLFLSYTVNANALGCLVPVFKEPQGGCGSSTPSPSPSPTATGK